MLLYHRLGDGVQVCPRGLVICLQCLSDHELDLFVGFSDALAGFLFILWMVLLWQ
jgi:hypothetical protein